MKLKFYAHNFGFFFCFVLGFYFVLFCMLNFRLNNLSSYGVLYCLLLMMSVAMATLLESSSSSQYFQTNRTACIIVYMPGCVVVFWCLLLRYSSTHRFVQITSHFFFTSSIVQTKTFLSYYIHKANITSSFFFLLFLNF